MISLAVLSTYLLVYEPRPNLSYYMARALQSQLRKKAQFASERFPAIRNLWGRPEFRQTLCHLVPPISRDHDQVIPPPVYTISLR